MSIRAFSHNLKVIFGHNFNKFVESVKHNVTNVISSKIANFFMKLPIESPIMYVKPRHGQID
jgi:hypothetical protein